MSDAKVKLIIEAATEEAKRKMEELAKTTDQGLQKAEKSARSFGDGMKAGWQKAKAAWVEIAAGVYSLKKAFDLANQAAQFKERESAFANMAASHGVAADKIVADLKRISHGTIDTMTLMEKAGTAMVLGIKADKLAEMMEIARASAKVTGQTVSQAFSDISLAVGRQSKMILDNLGIIVRVEDANEKYAAQLGKVSTELTDADKKQAFLNATLEAGREIVQRTGNMQESQAEKIQRMQAVWKNELVVLGKAVLTFAQGLEFAFAGVGVSMNSIVQKNAEMVSRLIDLTPSTYVINRMMGLADAVKEVGENSKKAAEHGVKFMSEKWDEMNAIWSKSEPIRGRVISDLEAQLAASKALAEQQKTDAQTRAEAITAMYAEIGLDEEAAAQLEVQKLAEKAANWEKAGVDVLKVNEYLYETLGNMSEKAAGDGKHDMSDYYATVQQKAKFIVQEFIDTQAEAEARMAAVDKSLMKDRALSIDDNASVTLTRIKNVLDSIQDKTVRVNVEMVQNSLSRSSYDVFDSAGNQLKDVEAEIAKNVKYGRSSVGGSIEDYLSGGSYVGWVPTASDIEDFDMGY